MNFFDSTFVGALIATVASVAFFVIVIYMKNVLTPVRS